jgi:hypothetical protein
MRIEADAAAESIEIGVEDNTSVAAIEIGGSDEGATKEKAPLVSSDSTASDSHSGRLASAPGTTKTVAGSGKREHSVEEELVFDCYARLDAVQPRHRTAYDVLPFQSIGDTNEGATHSAAAKPAADVHRKARTAGELDASIQGIMDLLDEAIDGSDDSVRSLTRNERDRVTFDVVLPEEDDPAGKFSSQTSVAQRSDADAATARPYRPYEQLFSELRRRKGA